MKRFVLDASVALAWFVDRPMPSYADRVRQLLLAGDRAVVPSLWRREVANGLVMAERRGILTISDTTQILQNLEIILAQAIDESPQFVSMHHLIVTARRFRLTAYDAEYLETARLQQLPLATLDRDLAKVAEKAGVTVLR